MIFIQNTTGCGRSKVNIVEAETDGDNLENGNFRKTSLNDAQDPKTVTFSSNGVTMNEGKRWLLQNSLVSTDFS